MAGTKVAQLNSLVNTTYDPMRVELLGVSSWRLHATRLVDGWTARHLGDHVHALTEAVAAEAREQLRVDDHRITVIPRGRERALLEHASADTRTATRDALGLTADSTVVLTVGRQDLQKAQGDLVRAVAPAKERIPALQLLIVGREERQATPSQTRSSRSVPQSSYASSATEGTYPISSPLLTCSPSLRSTKGSAVF